MTINGVQDLNACPGRLEGILNRRLSRGAWNKIQACPGGHLQVCPILCVCVCVGGGDVVVIHNWGVRLNNGGGGGGAPPGHSNYVTFFCR